MNCRISYIALILCLSVLSCSKKSMVVEQDSTGRVNKKTHYHSDESKTVEEITYDQNSVRPLKILRTRFRNGTPVSVREDVLTYTRNHLLQNQQFFVLDGGSRKQSGKVVYHYSGTQLKKIEFYSKPNIDAKKMYCSGIQVFEYILQSPSKMRIIEYSLSSSSRKAVQVSQHVVQYDNNKPVSMQSWILDRKTNNVEKKEISNEKEIAGTVRAVEQRLYQNSRGAGLK